MKDGLNYEDRKNNYLILAESYELEGKNYKAIEKYKKALNFTSLLDDRILILFRQALIYDEMGEYLESINIYDRILEADKSQFGAYYGLAIAYEELGEYDKAIKNYEKAIEVNEDYDRAYYYMANLYDKMGDLDKAIKYYKKVIDIIEDYKAYNNLAGIYEELNQDDKAMEMVNKSIELNGEFYQSLYNKGVLKHKKADYKRALNYYYRALDYKPSFENIYLNISEVYFDMDCHLEAVEILNLGIENCPKAADLYYNRACAYSILKDKDKSLSDLKKSIELDSDNINYARLDDDFKNLYELEEFKKIIIDE